MNLRFCLQVHDMSVCEVIVFLAGVLRADDDQTHITVSSKPKSKC